jgi:methionyl-tRNA formyltransferase
MSSINKVLFIGSKRLGLKAAEQMYHLAPKTLIGLLTLDDTNDTRTVLSEFQQFASQHNLNLYIAKSRKQSEQIIADLQPDLCFVVSWYWLISRSLLNQVPDGFIGIHASLLPKFRGGSPLVWSIITGQEEVGFSLFSFTPGTDDGPIWAQGQIRLQDQDYISDVLLKVEHKIIQVLQETYLAILHQTVRPVEQNQQLATYCAQRFPRDGLIDWSKPAWELYNFIRAQSVPYPGAFTYYGSSVLKIWRAKPFRPLYYGTPGQIARIANEGVYVICGNNQALILEDVELEGRVGLAKEFITSIKSRLSSEPVRVLEQK